MLEANARALDAQTVCVAAQLTGAESPCSGCSTCLVKQPSKEALSLISSSTGALAGAALQLLSLALSRFGAFLSSSFGRVDSFLALQDAAAAERRSE